MHSFAGGFEHPLVDVSQEKPGSGPSGGLCHLIAVVPLSAAWCCLGQQSSPAGGGGSRMAPGW